MATGGAGEDGVRALTLLTTHLGPQTLPFHPAPLDGDGSEHSPGDPPGHLVSPAWRVRCKHMRASSTGR